MTSFLKIFPRPRSKEVVGMEELLKGPFIPLDTLDLDYSISAVTGNLSLNCKSCKNAYSSITSDGNTLLEKMQSFSGYIGIISKGIFMIYQLDLNLLGQFTYNIIQNLEISQIGDNSVVKPTINGVSHI
jgi:hypothetical protein